MFTVRAPAKLNLDLRVGPVRPDGFHPISSWFVTVDFCDTLLFTPATEDRFTCSDPSLPTDERNLVVRAMNLVPHPPLHVALDKRIPCGAGLGGGSSDAASTLVTLAQVAGTSPDHARAAQLGSDVPFFLSAPSALCTSRGEVVTPLPTPATRAALLFLPGLHISTPAIFRAFDGSPLPSPLLPHHAAAKQYENWARLPASELLPHLANDLEPATFALHPALATLRLNLERQLARPVRMTGSGSTLFTLYDTMDDATSTATLIRECKVAPARLCPIEYSNE